jgi:hypothetical protein
VLEVLNRLAPPSQPRSLCVALARVCDSRLDEGDKAEAHHALAEAANHKEDCSRAFNGLEATAERLDEPLYPTHTYNHTAS